MKTVLGATYRDRITGFEGVATGRCEYITGCNQVLLAPRYLNDGRAPDPAWVDEQRVERVGETVVSLDNGASPGFDKLAPKR